jgi:ComF family protein
MLKILSHAILSVVYPQGCELCGREVESDENGTACSGCWDKTKIFTQDDTLCTKCGAFLFGAYPSGDSADCHRCSEHHYDRARAIGTYHHAMSISVLRLKHVPKIPRKLHHLASAAFDQLEVGPAALVIPVPLSARRRKERGFNQAAVIAALLATRYELELDEASLVRRVHTPMHRVGMDRKARASTVRNAFEITRPNLIAGRDIILVDDVLTSGETVSSCAKELKENGAAKVNVFTLARAA